MKLTRRMALTVGGATAIAGLAAALERGDRGLLEERPAQEGGVEDPMVSLGVDVLAREGFSALRGRRVGLITNHTGLDSAGVSTIDLIGNAPEVQLVCLMAPEHGLRGDQDYERIPSSRDSKTGLPVFSLYGETREPTTEMLSGLDALVFDIQDVGARFYTYISTLSLAMAAAGQRGIPVVVLDRPNPASGAIVEGPVCDAALRSFVGQHEIPMRHGMTVGELAQLFHGHFGVGIPPMVVPCRGWRRRMFWHDTGLPFVGPSPNLRTVDQAIIYPGPCLVESSNLSVGRGTEAPFQLVGAPWMDPEKVLERLPSLPGVRLRSESFVPAAGSGYPYAGESCRGIHIALSDRPAYRAAPLGLGLAVAIRDTCEEFTMSVAGFARLCGRQAIVDAYFARAGFDTLMELAQEGISAFMEVRSPLLLYPDA